MVLKWDQDPKDLDSREPTFDVVLDSACERLKEKQIQISIQRIKEMDEVLKKLEEELDQIIIGSLV